MQLKYLISVLEPLKPRVIQIADPDYEVLGVHILSQGAVPKESHLLYFCTWQQFLGFQHGLSSGSFLLFGPDWDAISLPPLVPGLNLFLLPEQMGPQQAYSLLARQILLEQRVTMGTTTMLSGLLENRGLQRLIDVAYTVLRNPIFVSDVSNHYLANAYDENTFEPEGSFARFILSDLLYNYVDDGGRELMHRLNLDDMLTRAQEPLYLEHPRFEKETVFICIRVHNVIVGKLFSVAIEHPFTEEDRRLFPTLAELVGQEFQKNKSIVSNRFERNALMLIDLITSSYAEPEMMKRSNASFQYTPGSLCLLAVAASEKEMRQEAIPVYCAQLRKVFPNAPVAALDGRVVALLFPGENQNIASYVQQLRAFACQQHVQIGMSNPFRDLSRARCAYEQALRALSLEQRFMPREAVASFQDVLVPELITGYQQNAKAVELILPEILSLLEFDKKNGSDYTRTLQVYLKHMGKSQKICNELHIHKNTLVYRVEKLREYFGLTLDDGEQAWKYQLSFYIIGVIKSQGS